jgi:alkanesulfonate monooxygenase SsuD/methylene tetrahydromethanopterin reductase-like flavin-dependent oxidoreductase (luciferase family)
MLELAGRTVAGTTLSSCGPRTIAAHIAPVINAVAADAGRPPPQIQAMVEVAVTDDPAAAHAESVESGQLYAALPAYRRVLDLEGIESGADLLLGSWTVSAPTSTPGQQSSGCVSALRTGGLSAPPGTPSEACSPAEPDRPRHMAFPPMGRHQSCPRPRAE